MALSLRSVSLSLAFVALFSCQGKESRAEAHATKGVQHGREGRLGEALASFDRALQEDPRNLKALYNSGIALLGSGRAEEAASRFRGFLSIRPDDALGHFHLARCALRSGKKEEAIASLQEAIRLGFSNWVEWKAAEDLSTLASDHRFAQLEVLVAQRAGHAGEEIGPGRGYEGVPFPHALLPGLRRPTACDAGAAVLEGVPAGACAPEGSP